MPALPHRIRRQSFRVKARSQAEAFAIRKRLREDWEATLLPALERAFDEADSEGAILRIPKLHVNVRIAAVEDIAEQLPELIYQEIRRQLTMASQSGEIFRSTPLGAASSSEPSSMWARTTLEQDRLQVLARYVETGSLPWPLTSAGRSAILAQLQGATADELASVLGQFLRGPMDRELLAFSFFRVLQLVPRDQWGAVAALVAARLTGADRELLVEIIAVLAEDEFGPSSRYARVALAATAMATSVASSERPDEFASADQGAGERRDRSAEEWALRLAEFAGPQLRQWLAIHREHALFYVRLFSLVPQEEWLGIAGVVAAGLPEEIGTALREAIALLTGDVAAHIPRETRLELAAAAMAASRRGTERVTGEARGQSSEEEEQRRGPPDATAGPKVRPLHAVGAIFRQWLDRDHEQAEFYFRLLSLIPKDQWMGMAAVLPGEGGAALAEIIAGLASEAPGGHEELSALWPESAGGMRAGFYLRLLSLVPKEQWIVMAKVVQAALPRNSSAALLDIIAMLAGTVRGGEEVGSISPGMQVALAAAAMAARHAVAEPVVDEAAGIGRPAARLQPARGEPAEPGRRDAAATRPSPSEIRVERARDMLSETAFLRRAADPGRRGEAPEAFPLAVSSAGLVLLHPFLPRFFETTGIKEARRTELAPAGLPRAAALLHLLATGEEEPYEFDLGFIKILVGLPPESHLPISAGLLQAVDHEEADALLQAVIGHWSALKSTSVQGLRTSFLQRRGFVREDEQGVRLQVELESFDMLLGALPWGIGTVKLPWMKKPIFTEWLTP